MSLLNNQPLRGRGGRSLTESWVSGTPARSEPFAVTDMMLLEDEWG
ncbi:hypothetical protein GCM10025873_07860 [Demequina sediminis]|nr:hypothetical protein GCM10025873_07860 [Demequina sediminis]